MTTVRVFLMLMAVALMAPELQAQSFTSGNLAVLRQGDGSQTLANTGNTIIIDQYTTNGSLVSSFTVPDSGPTALIQSGTATSEGQLTRSPDGRSIAFAGYNTARPYTGGGSVAGSTGIPRAVGVMDYLGNYSLKTTKTTIFSKNNIRAGLTDGTNVWACGQSSSGSGTFFLADAAVGVSSLLGNIRSINICNGNLYVSTGSAVTSASNSGTNIGIWMFDGVPTNAATPVQVLPTGTNSSPFDFAVSPSGNTIYVADDSATNGVQRWDKINSIWTLRYTFTTGSGARSLAVDFGGARPVIYAITGSPSKLMRFIDNGVASAGTSLVTAPSGTVFRGVKFAPTGLTDPALTAPVGLAPSGIVTQALPTLTWSPVAGASGYVVDLITPSGFISTVQLGAVTNTVVPQTLHNGDYSWTVTPASSKGKGPAATAKMTVQLPVLRFAVVCDNQSEKTGDTYPMYANDSISDQLIYMARQLTNESVDFVLFGGDLIGSKDLNTNTISALSVRLEAWKAAMKPVFSTGVPVYPVRGNHDAVFYDGPPDSPALAAAASNIWKTEFSSLTNFSGPAGALGYNYTFSRSGVLVIGMDDYLVPGKLNTNWLKSVLATNTDKRTFILKHQPIWTDSDKRNPSAQGDLDMLVSILDKYAVTAVFCGHVHTYDRLTPNNHVFQQVINGKAGSPATTITYTTPTGWSEYEDGGTNFGYAIVTVQGTNVGMAWKRFTSTNDPGVIVDSFTNNVALLAPDTLSPTHLVLSQTSPKLTWSPVAGAQSYVVTLTFPNRTTTSWSVLGLTNWTIPSKLSNGNYSWTVTAQGTRWTGAVGGGAFVVQSSAISLNATTAGNQAKITWPADTAPGILEAISRAETNNWQTVGQSPVVTGTQNVVTLPATNAGQFYRLKIPAP